MTREQAIVYELHHPSIWMSDEIYTCGCVASVVSVTARSTYPAHLHIDLMARAQGSGNGKQMMATLLADLRARGVPGVHLGMSDVNHRAYAFYTKVRSCVA